MKQLPLYFEGQDVNRVEDKMNLQKIREVMLSIMSQLVPSLYQVDSYMELSDNQSLNKLLANIRTKSGNECLKSMESWADIRILDKVVKVINTLYIETSLKDLQGISNITNRTRFKKQIIDPMIFLGIVEMTVPDKPNSRYQLYRLSKIGKELFTL
ncbi:MAG: Fic family protein [Candidatus Cryptobacteroides sp.]